MAVVAPRQNLKTTIFKVRQLAGLYLFDERLQTHTAHRVDTCLEQFRDIKPLAIALSDATGNRRLKLRKIIEANGQESIELMSGQRLLFKARSKESGRGFGGNTVYLDEAMRLSDVSGLMPTLSAQPNPQLWYGSSAPLPKAESDILRAICRRGRRAARRESREPRLAFFEFCASEDPGPRPDVDEDSEEFQEWLARWRKALAEGNLALGRRITEEFCETERAAMDHEDFIRERFGIYPEDVENTDPAIDEDDWQSCRDEASKVNGPKVLTFEVSLDRKWAQIAVAAPSTAGGTHVEIIENRRRTGWVVERLVELRDTHKPIAILCNPAGPAGALLSAAKKAGLDIGLPDGTDAKGKPKFAALTGRDYVQACGAAADAIAEHQWRHIDQPELNMAVTGAAKRTVGDAFVFDRRGTVDISPLLAVTLAAWGAGRSVPDEPKESDFVVI